MSAVNSLLPAEIQALDRGPARFEAGSVAIAQATATISACEAEAVFVDDEGPIWKLVEVAETDPFRKEITPFEEMVVRVQDPSDRFVQVVGMAVDLLPEKTDLVAVPVPFEVLIQRDVSLVRQGSPGIHIWEGEACSDAEACRLALDSAAAEDERKPSDYYKVCSVRRGLFLGEHDQIDLVVHGHQHGEDRLATLRKGSDPASLESLGERERAAVLGVDFDPSHGEHIFVDGGFSPTELAASRRACLSLAAEAVEQGRGRSV